VKRTFGTWTTRLLRGGHQLTEGEYHILCLLIAELPPSLRSMVEAQFDSYNLAQREVDKRTLNFYRVRVGHRGVLPVTPLLKSKLEVAPLVRLTVRLAGQIDPLHAVLTAVNGRAFSASFSRPIPDGAVAQQISVGNVTQAWMSNFDLENHAA
jgi:hypothetical protein